MLWLILLTLAEEDSASSIHDRFAGSAGGPAGAGEGGTRMAHEISPTARALLALEAIQNVPGITAARLGERLGVTERAARRYVAILREAELPIESVSGPYGGYQVGHGLRLPPLTFTAGKATNYNCSWVYTIKNGAFVAPNGTKATCASTAVMPNSL